MLLNFEVCIDFDSLMDDVDTYVEDSEGRQAVYEFNVVGFDHEKMVLNVEAIRVEGFNMSADVVGEHVVDTREVSTTVEITGRV